MPRRIANPVDKWELQRVESGENTEIREIVLKPHVKEYSIRNYICRIFEKLGVSSRVELVLYALSQRDPGK